MPASNGNNSRATSVRTIASRRAGRRSTRKPRPPVAPLVTNYWRPEHFFNRELSWMEFNARVLEEALDPTVPLLERVKFLAIFSNNLDEFFMIRVAGVKRQIDARIQSTRTADGMSPRDVMTGLSARMHELVNKQHGLFINEILPQLAEHGIDILEPDQLSDSQRAYIDDYFRRTILPVVTPLAVDPGHPFPYLANGTLCLVAEIRKIQRSIFPHTNLSVIHLPTSVMPRFLELPSENGRQAFFMLEDVILMNLDMFYNGYEVLNCASIRVTRDADVDYEEEGAEDLLKVIEEGIRNRRNGAAVRLQYDPGLSTSVLNILVEELELESEDLYPTEGFTAFSDLIELYDAIDRPDLRDEPFPSQPVTTFDGSTSIWTAIKQEDILLHHPYHQFNAVVRFVSEAAEDPHVLAIKMTLYRVSANSPITRALTRAAENGKEVSVLLELKARFDEAANIQWARQLEEAGAHVIYGIPGLKTHCKACLVVRREGEGILRYCHLGTGNYNDKTARIYADFGLFTAKEEFGEDVTQLFNLLTGYALPTRFHHLILSPTSMREDMVKRLRRESERARNGHAALVIAKINSLVDPDMIVELYQASQAGVQIQLIIRGICCLKPGVPGLSENISVISIVDRFLEHVRLFYFYNDGEPEYLLSSADWMDRNLNRRVEISFPVIDRVLQAELWAYLKIQLKDNVKARALRRDGTYRYVKNNGKRIRSQKVLFEQACETLRVNSGVKRTGSGRS